MYSETKCPFRFAEELQQKAAQLGYQKGINIRLADLALQAIRAMEDLLESGEVSGEVLPRAKATCKHQRETLALLTSE
jgi:hypothetical protein